MALLHLLCGQTLSPWSGTGIREVGKRTFGQMRPEDANEDAKYRYILMPMRI